MRIVVSGASGLIGSALTARLQADGHQVLALTRSAAHASASGHIFWNPDAGALTPRDLEGADGVVHLAGEPIVGRWTAEKKSRILNSRVRGTALLARALTALAQPPRVLICASAIGYYGDRGHAVLYEESAPGRGFLAEVCQAWEAAARPATARGIRVVQARNGIVLSLAGGALAKMLPIFRLGLGGRLGSGRQYWSWVSLDDVVEALVHALTQDALTGPMNLVAPQPVTNAEFTRTLGSVLKRPAFLPAPAMGLRWLLGEMADALLLGSARVEPRQLLVTGYRFQWQDLEGALRHLLLPPPASSISAGSDPKANTW